MPTKIHVVIPVYNRRGYTEKCLAQLREQTWEDLDVIIVDDGSSDGTAEMIRIQFPEVRLINGDGTLYWTGSMYVGVEAVLKECDPGDYVLVLNDDLIFDPDFVEILAETARKHPNALIHALNAYEDTKDIIDFGGVTVNWWIAKKKFINRGQNRTSFPVGYCQPSDILWGRGLMVPAQVFREIGNYDRRIVHRGDPELPRRAAKAGYELLVAYDAVAYMYREKNPNINERKTYALAECKDYFFGVLSQGQIKNIYLNSMLMTNCRLQGYVFFIFYLLHNIKFFFSRVRFF